MYECRREKFFFYNRLSILLKAVLNERTTVDLRNEASIYGTVESVDGLMNIVMKDCVFTDPRGDSYNYELFFVLAKNIRCVHIPPKIRIIPAIKEQLRLLSGYEPQEKIEKRQKWTYKQKRTLQKQLEGLSAMETILKEKRDAQGESSQAQRQG